MTTDDREREMRLKAAELHGVMPETVPTVGIEAKTYDYGAIDLSLKAWKLTIPSCGKNLSIGDGMRNYIDFEAMDLDTLIALLQRAKEIMGGGA